ncbi:BamA/TamA family outer membrane protein [Segetibacter aerophilus]|uniref:Membrane protein n=1 Tax=Segetibacter aerophilus TaxID=670293 RepID=A0A512BDH9_9BACT|nr:BamA/TamA family outer membrane protein [Segetibacter aerophilus]GEO09994.1 membrane protein [Segetibacter aerophilus]
MFHYGAAYKFLIPVLVIMLLASCTVVKNYPANTPFVFKNKINVTGEISKDEKNRLQTELYNYWDDSLKVNSILQFGVRTVIKNPNVFDSADINRSVVFMNSFLTAQGYYNSLITPQTPIVDTVEDQYRTTVEMDISVNKSLKIDSVAYDTSFLPELRKLALENKEESRLIKNKPFTQAVVSGELDRLVALFRKNGFYRFTRENLYAEVDTTDISLLEVTLDPFEQARKISESIEKRKQNPTINITIKPDVSADSNAFRKYYTGKIFYYPQTLINQPLDSVLNKDFPLVTNQREFTLKQETQMVIMRPLREHTYLKEGTIYNEESYYKTINAFSQLGPWSQVDVRAIPRTDSASILDFHFFLTPASKYSFGYDFEVSRNSGSIYSSNLLGITNVLTLRNRNLWKRAVQSSTNVRAGVELGFTDTAVLQTIQASVSQTFSIPRFITPFKITGVKSLDDYKTVINLNASYTDRRNFFRLRSAVASWGYEWRKNNHVWLYRPLNIELYSLDTLSGLLAAFEKNPFLRTAFNTGYVISQNITYSITFTNPRHPNVTNNLRISAEEAGGLMGRFVGLRNKIYQYLKFESEFSQVKQWRKTSFAYRLFGGIGYNYSNDPVIGQSLPFFKQFAAGGPNSMRAWGLRQLGLGSSLASDTSTGFRDRFGDIQLEADFEYRFPITTIGGVKINSALFADVGNIWNLKNIVENPESKLTLDRLGRDIAIAAGTGLRFDFNYFLVRFDFAYKVKDPARRSNNGWMSISDFEWRNREYVKYINGRELKRNNFAFQLGIGLPF